MATLAGELLIKMGLDVAQLRRDAEVSKRLAQDQAQAWSGAASLIKTGLAGIVASFTVNKLVDSFHQTVSALSQLDDAAEIAGTSVESLSGLMGVAAESGVGLSGLTDIMQKLTKATLANEQESAKAAQAWAALKIDPKTFNDPAELLMVVAKGFDSFADGARKAELAQALLGKAGQQALPLLKDLAEKGMEQGRVTSEMAAEAERLEKQWARLSYEGDVFRQTIMSKIIPGLADLVMQFNKARAAGLGFFDALDTIPGAGADKNYQIALTMKAIADQQERLDRASARSGKGGDLAGMFSKREINDASEALAGLNKKLEVLRAQKTDMEKRDPKLSDVYGFGSRPGRPDAPDIVGGDAKGKKGVDWAAKQAEAILEVHRQLSKVIGSSAEASMIFETTEGKYKEFSAKVKETLIAESRRVDEQKKTREGLDKEAAQWNQIADVQEHIKKLKEDQEKQDETAVDNAIKLTQTAIQAEKARQQKILDERFQGGAMSETQWKEATDVLQGLKKEAKETKDIFTELGATFESSFERAIESGATFGDFMSSLGKDLAKIFAREFITGPIMKNFKDMLAQMRTEVNSTSSGSSGGASLPSWLSSGFSLVGTLFGGGAGGGGQITDTMNAEVKGVTNIINIDSRSDAAFVRANVAQGVKEAYSMVADANQRNVAGFK